MKKKRQNKTSCRSGFTLIEILLVVVIIGVLAGIAIPRIGGRTEQAKTSQAQANISSLGMAIQEYEMVNGAYPPSLDALLDESKGGPFMEKKSIPMDPWGKPYDFRAPGANNSHTFDLSCTTPKGKVVNNWE